MEQTSTRSWANRDPSLGQTSLFLFDSTVKSAFGPVCPWDGWGFIAGTIVPQALPSENCLCVFCVYWFLFAPPIFMANGSGLGLPHFQARKKSVKINFLGPETTWWGGARGWWPKSSRPPSKVCLPWVSKREIWDAGMSQTPGGVQKSLCKKSLCAFFVP